MSDEEVVKFEITDYDIENEFNFNRPKGHLTKHKQIYGIWAQDSDDENETNPQFPKNSMVNHKNYSAPVCFVLGGIQHAGKSEEKNNTLEESEEEGKYQPDSFMNVASSSDEMEDDSSQCEESQKSNLFSSSFTGEMAGFRRKRSLGGHIFSDNCVGTWEKHTKGIGAKLLLQMGFQPGKGLGKDLQGISTPIEAYQRKGRGSVGAYGPEKDCGGIKYSDKENVKQHREKLSQWKCSNIYDKKNRVRYMYRNVHELIESGKMKVKKGCSNQCSRVKVIDMTGPKQRVLTGYHAIAGQRQLYREQEFCKDRNLTNFALPELQHNIDTLIDIIGEDLITNKRRLNYISDRRVLLEKETSTLQNCIDQENKQMQSLQNTLLIIESMFERSTDKMNPLTLEAAVEYFRDIQNNYYEEYVLYEISNLATLFVGPLLKDTLKSWMPLENPGESVIVLKQWKEVLETGTSQLFTGRDVPDPFCALLWNCWLPHIETAVNSWNCWKCEPLIELFEVWLPIIPVWLLQYVHEHLVLPRITQEVEAWDPMTDPVPIHMWIHPWIPVLGEHLDATVYPIIKHKLSMALMNWHPSDPSARLMLEPWAKAFAWGDMDAFLIKNILPKLQMCLQELVINPHEQHLEKWKCVIDWEGLLPQYSLACLLERFFFPKWLQVLTVWLSSDPNYDDVCSWYLGWKGMLSASLLTEPGIKEQFRKALNMMNQAVLQPMQGSSSHPSTMREPSSLVTNIEPDHCALLQSQNSNSHPDLPADTIESIHWSPQSFKELVLRQCEKRGITFVPIANKSWEGKQVYRCGKIQMYIDRNVIFVSENGSVWHPTSLSTSLDIAVK